MTLYSLYMTFCPEMMRFVWFSGCVWQCWGRPSSFILTSESLLGNTRKCMAKQYPGNSPVIITVPVTILSS